MAETSVGGEIGHGIVDLPGGSFSRLLLSDDSVGDGVAADYCNGQEEPVNSNVIGGYEQSTLFSVDTPKMLCFGVNHHDDCEMGNSAVVGKRSNPVSKLSSTAGNNKRTNRSSERKVSGVEDRVSGGAQRVRKKVRSVTAAGGRSGSRTRSNGHHAKTVRKEKLGERITALQQLVSPYGKTDTASVLHEAMGYIRFLQDQVKVLCSPYLTHQQHLPSRSSSSSTLSSDGGGSDREFNKNGGAKSLKTRGLCLIPVNCISHIITTSSNGADFWSPAAPPIATAALIL